jgi:hypothetical protein
MREIVIKTVANARRMEGSATVSVTPSNVVCSNQTD